ncbi:MAG TPA: acyltransferase [Marmoricola sp.]|nr:acyltransferase [Marmoricola sp.]HRV69189.1 acyltransferase [Marmoricola sp.]
MKSVVPRPKTKASEAAPHTGSYFPALDSIRAFGAIAVVATHTSFMSGAYVRHSFWGPVLAHLDIGVAIFFVLSGFLLSRQWLARRATSRPLPETRDYFWKRFLRIYPVYLIGILPALLWVQQDTGFGLVRWITNLLMIDLYLSPRLPHGMTQMWSLTTEVAFYIILPTLIWLMIGRVKSRRNPDAEREAPAIPARRMGCVIASLFVINIGWFLLIPHLNVGPGTPALPQWLPGSIDWFAVGILLAWADLHMNVSEVTLARPVAWLRALGSTPWSCYAMAGALLLIASTPLAGPIYFDLPTPAEQITKNLLYALIGGLIVLPGVFTPATGSYRSIMTARIPRHLGLISYGIFCIHLPILSLLFWATPIQMFTGHGWLIFAMTLGLSLIAAELIHRFVEIPSYRLRGLLAKRSGSASESSTISL